jgi:hypothetical protein
VTELKRTIKPDEHEPYLEFLEWIFGGVGETFPPMPAERRVAWMQNQLPKTYAMMSLSHRWPDLSIVPSR